MAQSLVFFMNAGLGFTFIQCLNEAEIQPSIVLQPIVFQWAI